MASNPAARNNEQMKRAIRMIHTFLAFAGRYFGPAKSGRSPPTAAPYQLEPVLGTRVADILAKLFKMNDLWFNDARVQRRAPPAAGALQRTGQGIMRR